MFLPRITQPSGARAWLSASQAVYAQKGHEAHHVVIDIEDPLAESDADRAAIALLDEYLCAHSDNQFPVRTVANTIFPQSVYDDHGAPAFYDVYLNRIFPKLKRAGNDWGRYFQRMIDYPGMVENPNLLDTLVRKMKRNVEAEQTYRNIYELPLYAPARDAEGPPRGGQCLSFLSFKLDNEHRLLLSAIYRNHYYTERLLGNIVGLGRLMHFVANEVGVSVGPLTILSTHAEVDAAGGKQKDLANLLQKCASVLEMDTAPAT